MELEFCDWLKSAFGTHPALQIGIGDDAAVLHAFSESDLVVTNDTLMDGVHFRLAEHSPESIGHKAIAVNLSDLAAMGADPVAVVVGLVMPRGQSEGHREGLELARKICLGMKPLLDRFNVALAGGDTNSWEGQLVISVTVFGRAGKQVFTRSGAKAGDQLIVTGKLGGSILGHHLSFTPRVEEAITLRDRFDIHAAMDISDGLLLDASRLATASNVGVAFDFDAIPISKSAHELAAKPGSTSSALQHALADGEDFELLMAVSDETLLAIQSDSSLRFPVTRIGSCVEQPGVYRFGANDSLSPIEAAGFQHRF